MPNIRMIFECDSIAQLIAELTQQLESLSGIAPGNNTELVAAENKTMQYAPPAPVQSNPEVIAPVAAPAIQPAATVAPPPAPIQSAVPTAAVAHTLDQLIEAVSPIARDTAKIPQLQSLLNKYGATGMMELPVEAYGAFAADIRAMGARI